MINPGGDPSFTYQSMPAVRVSGQFRIEHFDGHFTMELHVRGAVDHAHTAAPNFLDDPEVIECATKNGDPPSRISSQKTAKTGVRLGVQNPARTAMLWERFPR